MEKKKRKYVKPKLTVAEWDFNEAVCQNSVALLSGRCITSEDGRLEPKEYIYGGSLQWHDYDTEVGGVNGNNW